MSVKPSLSLFLCVQNAQGSLSSLATRALEFASDLTPRFELILVDQGSRDATLELAHELRTAYPQIRVISLPEPLGHRDLARLLLSRGRGEVVLAVDAQQGLRPSALRLEYLEIVASRSAAICRKPHRPERRKRLLAV